MYQVLYVSTYERRYVQLHSVEQRQYSSSIYQVEDNSESLWYYYRSGTTIAAYIYICCSTFQVTPTTVTVTNYCSTSSVADSFPTKERLSTVSALDCKKQCSFSQRHAGSLLLLLLCCFQVIARVSAAVLLRSIYYKIYLFILMIAFTFSSSTRRFYPQRSAGQAVATGVVPSPPRYVPSIFIAHRVQHSHCSSIFIQCC